MAVEGLYAPELMVVQEGLNFATRTQDEIQHLLAFVAAAGDGDTALVAQRIVTGRLQEHLRPKAERSSKTSTCLMDL